MERRTSLLKLYAYPISIRLIPLCCLQAADTYRVALHALSACRVLRPAGKIGGELTIHMLSRART